MRSTSERWLATHGWRQKKDDKGEPYEYYSAGIGDDDFTFDGYLSITGDFGGEAKGEYAEVIAANLNAVPALRDLLRDVASFLASAQNQDPYADSITQPLLQRIVSLYPMLREYPTQNEPRQNAEQLEFNFRFRYTEEELRERKERATLLVGKRHLRGSQTLDEFLAATNKDAESKARWDNMRRLIRMRQEPLNWD